MQQSLVESKRFEAVKAVALCRDADELAARRKDGTRETLPVQSAASCSARFSIDLHCRSSLSPLMSTRVSPVAETYQSGLPWLDRVRSARTKRPLSERCTELTQLVSEGIANNAKDLKTCFILICESCFELQPSPTFDSDWGLKTVTRNMNVFDYDHLIAFFSPTGPLFRLLEALSKEPLPICEFPVEKLPACVCQSLDQPVIPAFYVNKYLPHCTVLHLKPLDYFIFAFMHYLQNDTMNSQFALETGSTISAAVAHIFELYLMYFVPTTSETRLSGRETLSPHSIWESLSSKTSNLLHLSSPSLSTLSAGSSFQSPAKPSLINAKQFQQTSYQTPALSNDESDSSFSQKAKCRTFLSIFSEMMLTVPTAKSTPQRMSPLSMKRLPQPTSDQVRYVRSLVKHLHMFANSCPSAEALRDPQFRLGTSALDDLKRTVWSPEMNLHSRLYNFLKFCFETWPSDASFRMPVETWLSYIQPWRYKQLSSAGKDDEDDDHKADETIGKEWLVFVANNLPFYNNMFLQVISRLTRFDLISSKNSVMVFRVMKVYAASRLYSLIKEAEESCNDKSRMVRSPASNRKSFLPTRSPTSDTTLIKHSFHENEELESESALLFSERSQRAACELYSQIHVAREMVAQELKAIKSASAQAKQGRGFIGFLKSLLDQDEEQQDEVGKNVNELKKTESHLNPSVMRLESIFGSEMFASECRGDQLDCEIRQRRFSTPSSAKKPTPDVVLSPDGATVLSPTGRTQLLNRLATSNITFDGNPDLQTTRTYEIDFLVRTLLLFSTLINARFGAFMQRHYSTGSLLSKGLQIILAPPASYTLVCKSGLFGETRRSVQQLPARVSLRWLADKRCLTLLSVLFPIAWLCGLRPLSLATYSLFAFFAAALVSYVCDKVRSLS